ncbi:RecB family exonuclease, partial [Patescibacteria group bacterium]
MDLQQSKNYIEYVTKLNWKTYQLEKSYIISRHFPFIGGLLKIQRVSILPSINKLIKYCQKNKINIVAIEPSEKISSSKLTTYISKIKKCKLKANRSPYLSTKSLIIDLTPPQTDIFKSFSSAKYYGEGKREKKISIFVTEAMDEEEINATRLRSTAEKKQLSLIDWQKIEEPKGESRQMALNYLSYTQIASFSTCPLQYKYRNILRIPVPVSAALTFGSTIHNTLEKFYRKFIKKEKLDIKILLDIYKHNWSSVGYGNLVYEEKMKKRGKNLLTEFFNNSFNVDEKVLDVEKKFKIRITPTLYLGGKIDRINLTSDGKYEILDYKTGQAPKTKNIASDQQLTVYALAAADIGMYGKKPDDIVVTFHFLDGGEKVSARR